MKSHIDVFLQDGRSVTFAADSITREGSWYVLTAGGQKVGVVKATELIAYRAT